MVGLIHGTKANPCASPYITVKGFLDYLQPNSYDRAKAALCFSRAGGVTQKQAEQLAVNLLEILDGKGLFIDISRLPVDSEFRDTQGLSRYQLAVTQPNIYLVKNGARWEWSDETIQAIPELHKELFVYNINDVVQELPTWLRGSYFGVSVWQLLGLGILALLWFIVRVVVSFLVTGQIRTFMKRVKIMWGEELLATVGKPIGTLGATAILILLWPLLRFPVQFNKLALAAFRAVVAISIVWILYRIVDLFTSWLTQKAEASESKLDDQLVPLIQRALKVFVVCIGLVFVLQSLDYDVAGLLAGLGIGGLAFALAAKDTLANIFGSATIFASRPFQIGDAINVGGVEGIVESVGFRSTRIRTYNSSVVTIPNAKIADSVVDNIGARRFRRFRTLLGLTYDTTPEQIQAFVEGVRAIIKASDGSRKDYYEVHFVEFGASSLNILVHMFFEVSSWTEELTCKHNLLLEIMRLAEDLGVTFAFPTQTLHLESVAEPISHIPAAVPPNEDLIKAVQAFGPNGALSSPSGKLLTNGYLPE